MHVFQRIGEPAKQRIANHGQDKKFTKRHHHARDAQNGKRNGIGPVSRALKRREALNLAACIGRVLHHHAFAPVEQCNRPQHDQQQSTTIGDDEVVAHLAPRLSGVSQLGARVLHEGLNQVTGFRGLTLGQAAVAIFAFAYLPPHRGVVAGLHFGTLGVGLFGVAGLVAGIRFHVKNILALDTAR